MSDIISDITSGIGQLVNDAAPLISEAAPLVGGAIGGPVGAAVGQLVGGELPQLFKGLFGGAQGPQNGCLPHFPTCPPPYHQPQVDPQQLLQIIEQLLQMLQGVMGGGQLGCGGIDTPGLGGGSGFPGLPGLGGGSGFPGLPGLGGSGDPGFGGLPGLGGSGDPGFGGLPGLGGNIPIDPVPPFGGGSQGLGGLLDNLNTGGISNQINGLMQAGQQAAMNGDPLTAQKDMEQAQVMFQTISNFMNVIGELQKQAVQNSKLN